MLQVADDGTDYDYSVQQDYGSISNYSTLRTATRYLTLIQDFVHFFTALLFAPLDNSMRALQKTGQISVSLYQCFTPSMAWNNACLAQYNT